MESPKILENLFYAITVIATFTCIIRSDYNFAFGLLCYYMMKSSQDPVKTAKPVHFFHSILIYNFIVVTYQHWIGNL